MEKQLRIDLSTFDSAFPSLHLHIVLVCHNVRAHNFQADDSVTVVRAVAIRRLVHPSVWKESNILAIGIAMVVTLVCCQANPGMLVVGRLGLNTNGRTLERCVSIVSVPTALFLCMSSRFPSHAPT